MSTEILRPKLPPLLRAPKFRKVLKQYPITVAGLLVTIDGKILTKKR